MANRSDHPPRTLVAVGRQRLRDAGFEPSGVGAGSRAELWLSPSGNPALVSYWPKEKWQGGCCGARCGADSGAKKRYRQEGGGGKMEVGAGHVYDREIEGAVRNQEDDDHAHTR